jgi:hypothetical protein
MKSTFLLELRLLVSEFQSIRKWRIQGYSEPSPHFVKLGCLARNGFPKGTWIETGTYFGDTAAALSKIAPRVYTIEPEPFLFRNANLRFQRTANVDVVLGLSEEQLPGILDNVSGDVNFWLDGHFSEGVTHKGPIETPIVEELRIIETHLHRLHRVCVLVDDVRLFSQGDKASLSYPPLDYLVDWARRNSLVWHIEHDIFVARKA